MPHCSVEAFSNTALAARKIRDDQDLSQAAIGVHVETTVADVSDRLHNPVLRAVDFLAGIDDDPIDIAVSLIRARQPRER